MYSNAEMSEGEGEESRAGWQPSERRGACSFAYNGAVYVFQGYEGSFVRPVTTPLYRFLLQDGRWEMVPISADLEQSSVVSGACCCLLGDRDRARLVTFGGWENGERVADVHQLELSNMAWSQCDVKNPAEGPILKDKAGMIPYGSDMVCVVGGYGCPSEHHVLDGVYGQKGALYHWDRLHDLCWTNEVHLFQMSTGKWISPQMSGQRPPPCAAFSLTMVDCFRAVLFGGRQRESRVNHMYILHMDSWHWEGVLLPASPEEPWPSSRSFHATSSLVDASLVTTVSQRYTSHRSGSPPPPPSSAARRLDWLPCPPPDLLPSDRSLSLRPRLIVLWGMDNEGEPVPDCWMLQLDPVAWSRVAIPASVPGQPRLWHVMGACHPTPAEAHAVVFGGSTQNLFRQPDPFIQSVSGTVVFEFGVPSLYRLCMQYVALLPDAVLATLPSVLPAYVVREIERQTATNRNYQHFSVTRL